MCLFVSFPEFWIGVCVDDLDLSERTRNLYELPEVEMEKMHWNCRSLRVGKKVRASLRFPTRT